MKLDMVFSGAPIPYTRMTQGTRWTERSQNYLGYRNALADALRTAFPSWVIPQPPPVVLKKERAAYTKEQNKISYWLGVDVWFVRDSGDWDNAYKAVADSLQVAGIVWNDKRIVRSLGGWRYVDKENPRIKIHLERFE